MSLKCCTFAVGRNRIQLEHPVEAAYGKGYKKTCDSHEQHASSQQHEYRNRNL